MNDQKAQPVALQAPFKPIQAARQRRQLRSFIFHMGPVTLCVTSVILIALMAVLYLGQLGQAVSANQRIQNANAEQAALMRENQDLQDTLAREQSPSYIAEHAKQQGLVPVDPKNVLVIPAHNIQPIPGQNVSMLP